MKALQEAEKLKSTQEVYRQLLADIKEKELLEQDLIQKCGNLNKATNRYLMIIHYTDVFK